MAYLKYSLVVLVLLLAVSAHCLPCGDPCATLLDPCGLPPINIQLTPLLTKLGLLAKLKDKLCAKFCGGGCGGGCGCGGGLGLNGCGLGLNPCGLPKSGCGLLGPLLDKLF
ncbi:uncharacterized protein LOC130448799 [Diorhabda sublineata]|uniref:uncharacterized protein LOC130448799 n=1 Tax=Diorhabda sublineata TaxID=1163346 RepID=UPI0024E0D21C|nr:uncharacterized protein LOC130448799 [Diorhabda sublineata]